MFPFDVDETIWFPDGYDRFQIMREQIVYIESSNQYCYVYCMDDSNRKWLHHPKNYSKIVFTRKIILAKLCDMEAGLEQYGFCRTGKSFVVNLGYVTSYRSENGGDAVLFNGMLFSLSKDGKEKFFEMTDCNNKGGTEISKGLEKEYGPKKKSEGTKKATTDEDKKVDTSKTVVDTSKSAVPQKPSRKKKV